MESQKFYSQTVIGTAFIIKIPKDIDYIMSLFQDNEEFYSNGKYGALLNDYKKINSNGKISQLKIQIIEMINEEKPVDEFLNKIKLKWSNEFINYKKNTCLLKEILDKNNVLYANILINADNLLEI